VVSSIIGSPSEKRTCISVKGFERKVLKSKLEKVMDKLDVIKNELIINKQELSIYSNTVELTKEQIIVFERVKDKFYELRDQIKNLEDERKALTNYLRTHGEGEVSIMKKAYPNTFLQIKKIIKEINNMVISTSFYIQDGELKQL
jgi:uncharacterized protein (DUF342 family)